MPKIVTSKIKVWPKLQKLIVAVVLLGGCIFAALKISNTFLVHLSLFAVALIYAIVFSIAREVMQFIPPFAFIVLRVGTSLFLFAILYMLFVRNERIERKDLRRVMACGIFGVGANMLLFFKGLSSTIPINGAILMTNTPIFVVVIAAIYKLEKITLAKISGILIASLGATLLLAGREFNFSGDTLKGDLMVTVNAIIYSFYLVHAKPLLVKYKPVTVSLYTFGIGFLFTIPFGAAEIVATPWNGILQNYNQVPHFWNSVIFKAAFIIIIASFVTYLLNAWALRHGSSSLVGSYIYLQPVLATLIAQLTGRDHLTWLKLTYMLLILTGVYLVTKRKKIKEVL